MTGNSAPVAHITYHNISTVQLSQHDSTNANISHVTYSGLRVSFYFVNCFDLIPDGMFHLAAASEQ